MNNENSKNTHDAEANTNNPSENQIMNNDATKPKEEDCGCGCKDCGKNAKSSQNVADKGSLPHLFTPELSNEAMAAVAGLALQPAVAPDPVAKSLPPKTREPGKWTATPRQTPVDPARAKADIESRSLPTNIYRPKTAPTGVKSLATGFASNTVAGPSSIVELSRSLKSDVDLVFEWVFNNIENLNTHGSQKGGLGALIDGYGNSFDQADLMVQLLREAGYTADYLFGELRMNGVQAASWLGTDPLNVFSAANFFANSGVPATTVWDGTEWVVEFSHCYVRVKISGTDYVFDPSLKTYTTKTKIDLATAMGYNATSFMNDARSGATITADYVQNMNRTNIRNNLDTLTMNLVDWIKTNNNGAGIDDILGGRQIVKNDASVPTRNTVHPFLKPGTTPTVWTAIPDVYKATLHIVYDTIDITFFSHDLAGKRLTLFFNGSTEAELRLDGVLLGTSSAQIPGSWNSVLFETTHPYPFGYGYQYVWERVWAGKPYLLCNSWGNAGPGAKILHTVKMQQAEANGLATTDEGLMGEYLAAIWKTWDSMGSKATDLCNRLTNCTTVHHHACGLLGWFDTPLTDIGAVMWSTSALDNNYDQASYNDTVLAMHGVALEAQIFKQTARIAGVSTTPLVDLAVSSGQKIFDGSSSNWTTNVVPNLVNYNVSDLNDIKTWYIDTGYRIGIPEDGLLSIGAWTGYGYYAIPTFGTFGLIGGAIKGGGGTEFITEEQWQTSGTTYNWQTSDCYPGIDPAFDGSQCGKPGGPGADTCSCWVYSMFNVPGARLRVEDGEFVDDRYPSTDPIDMVTGNYTFSSTDITIGSGSFPYALGFTRNYSSGSRYKESPLGLGWGHNYQLSAHLDTDGLIGMGYHSVLAAAATITEIFVCLDIQSDLTKPFDKYVTCALANKWFTDRITENLVFVQAAQKSSVFVKLPDGSYVSSSGETLVQNVGGTYTYKTLSGTQFNYNSLGAISTIVEPFGVTVSFSYDSLGRLETVSNSLGRQLTLAYVAGRLGSVSDGTGRSVSYTITSRNLVSVTAPNGKVYSFEYDQPGRMTKFFNPANPTVPIAVNTYDSLDRVKEQKDVNSNSWIYYFAGSRSEEVAPNGSSSVTYFGAGGNAVKRINQIGKKWTMEYDGRNRLIRSNAPEGNSVLFSYDTKDRILETRFKAKPGSGLADIVTSTTYDPTWGKIQSETNALGRVTTFSYDPANGNLLSIVMPTVTGVGTPTVSMTYNGRGQVLTLTAQDGLVTKNTYHATNETLTSTVYDFGVGKLNLTSNFGYNSRGDLVSFQDARGNTTLFDFSLVRQTTQITAPAPFSYLTKLSYDDNCNLIKVEKQTDDLTNPWQTFQFTYRADNRQLSTIDPNGQINSVVYDNVHRVWKTIDPLGRVVTRTYCDCNKLVTVTDPSGVEVQTYTYTDNGMLLTRKDARNFTTNWTYDGFDRPDKTTYPDLTFEQNTSYDAVGNVLSLRTRAAATVAFVYDELNRVKTRSPSGQATVTTSYDIAGRVTSVSTPVVAGDPSTGTFTNEFDSAGRFFKTQYPDGLSVTYQLDAVGNPVKTTYMDGYYIERSFDQLSRLTDIKLNGAITSAIQFQYDALSRRTKLVYENGTSVSYGYEDDNYLADFYQNFVSSSVGFNFAYDAAKQLIAQGTTDPANYRWTPPVIGTVSYATANSVNQYPTVGGTGLTYSTDGSLANDGVFKYEYTVERLLSRVRNAGTNAVIADYFYDPLLRQRQKNVGGTKTNFYYSGWQRLADYDGSSNTLQQRYVYGTGLDEVLMSVSGAGVKTYFHTNQQGSVIATSDAAGAVLNRYKYSPYGASSSLSGTSHGYTGQRFDSETGLYYCKTRHYSPVLGRFLQPDSIGYLGGSNMYTYADNNPTIVSDELGLTANTPYGSVAEALAAWSAEYRKASIGADREYGSALYRDCEGNVYYTAAIVGAATDSPGLTAQTHPSGPYTDLGWVHTHGAPDVLGMMKDTPAEIKDRLDFMKVAAQSKFDPDENFGVSDSAIAAGASGGKKLYLVTPTNHIYQANNSRAAAATKTVQSLVSAYTAKYNNTLLALPEGSSVPSIESIMSPSDRNQYFAALKAVAEPVPSSKLQNTCKKKAWCGGIVGG